MAKQVSFLDQLLELHNKICKNGVCSEQDVEVADEDEKILEAKNNPKEDNIVRIRELINGNKKTGT